MAGPKSYVNVGGVWKSLRKLHVRVGGTWKSVRKAYVRVGGLWKQIYSGINDTPKVIFLTSGSSFVVPSDWNNSIAGPAGYMNRIECIGAGAGGAGGEDNDQAGYGGGAGSYSRKSNLSLTPGASVSYFIGLGGAGGPSDNDAPSNNGKPGGDVWFQSTGTILAKGGICPTGGQATSCVGDVKFNGGNGATGSNSNPGYGGGGAGGPGGAGSNGSGTAGGAGYPHTWTATAGGTASPGAGGNRNVTGSLYGGGGGGGSEPNAGKAGRNGFIVITYYPLL